MENLMQYHITAYLPTERHQTQDEREVVRDGKRRRQQLICLEKVTQVGSCKRPAGRARTARINRAVVLPIHNVRDADGASGGQQDAAQMTDCPDMAAGEAFDGDGSPMRSRQVQQVFPFVPAPMRQDAIY